MGLGVLVRIGEDVALAGSCVLHSRSYGGECGGEVSEGCRARCAGVSDGEGDVFDLTPMFLESRDEGGVFLGLWPQVWFRNLGLSRSRSRRR